MANSDAKKSRLKQVREGKRNPESQRGSWHGISPTVRKTPTLVENKTKMDTKHKRKWNQSHDDDGSIFIYQFFGA